jgi:hypothetical protein
MFAQILPKKLRRLVVLYRQVFGQAVSGRQTGFSPPSDRFRIMQG